MPCSEMCLSLAYKAPTRFSKIKEIIRYSYNSGCQGCREIFQPLWLFSGFPGIQLPTLQIRSALDEHTQQTQLRVNVNRQNPTWLNHRESKNVSLRKEAQGSWTWVRGRGMLSVSSHWAMPFHGEECFQLWDCTTKKQAGQKACWLRTPFGVKPTC